MMYATVGMYSPVIAAKLPVSHGIHYLNRLAAEGSWLLVVGITHFDSLTLIISGKQDAFRIGEHLFFRGHSFAKMESTMSGEWRKECQRIPVGG